MMPKSQLYVPSSFMSATSLGSSLELGIVELSLPQAAKKVAERRSVLVKSFLCIYPHRNGFVLSTIPNTRAKYKKMKFRSINLHFFLKL